MNEQAAQDAAVKIPTYPKHIDKAKQNFAKASADSEKAHEKYEAMRKKDNEPVRGIFRFHEVPGGLMQFPFKKYKGDPVVRYDLRDGEITTIPYMVAKHLNTNCWYPEYGFLLGEKGTVGAYSPEGHVMKITRKVRRCTFQSLEFTDSEDLSPAGDIVGVEIVR